MEKFGVNISEEKKALLQKEANLMTKLTKLAQPVQGMKTASQIHEERSQLEQELMSVRSQLTELDSYEQK